MAEFQI